MEIFPKIKEPSITKANYTTLLKDVSLAKLTQIKTLMNTFNNNDDLYDMFMNRFRYYEINDESEDVFVQCVTDTFNEYVDYYQELYDNYSKQYDFATQNKRVTIRDDSSSTSKSEESSATGNSSSTHYDLPNKTVSSPDGYVDDVTKDADTRTGAVVGSSSNDYDSTVTTEFHNEFLTLKRQYLAQIRNVNHEFAEKFVDCFIKVYS